MKKLNAVYSFVLMLAAVFAFSAHDAAAQSSRRLPNINIGSLGKNAVKVKLGEVTLQRINFRDQTADLSIGFDISNSFIPVSLKDFDYSLSFFNNEVISGQYDGVLKLNGRRSTRVEMPVTVNLRSIPGVVWSAFRNRGNLSYDLETGFTLPLVVTEKRFDLNTSGEVPVKTLVDAASILRASRFN